MFNKDDQKNNEELEGELEKINEFKIPWYKKFLMKFFPGLFLKLSGWELGLDGRKIDCASKLFKNAKIQIKPLSDDKRGFLVTIDNKLTLWFYRDGDYFKFDGVEMGEYDD